MANVKTYASGHPSYTALRSGREREDHLRAAKSRDAGRTSASTPRPSRPGHRPFPIETAIHRRNEHSVILSFVKARERASSVRSL